MRHGVRKLWGLLLVLMLVILATVPAQGAYRLSDGPAGPATGDYAFVRLTDPPIASYEGTIPGYERTKPEKGKKLDLNTPAARQYADYLTSKRNDYKTWLGRQYPHVQVVAEFSATYNGLGLKLNGATPSQVVAGPGTAEAGFSGLYYKAMNTSHSVINTAPLWTALGGQADAGAGIKVGVIDSGIDQTHTFLSPRGMHYPDGFPKGDTRFTTEKVIVAKVFHQEPWQTAQAVDSHGTHVAGTVAGRAKTNSPMVKGLSGVAPGAWLGNYNVFPGNVASAYSLFIAKAVEEAVIDGMDVLNLSLGGSAHKGADLLDMAVNAAVDAGVVVAIAAGNDGPGYYTVGSPGTASNVITVAAVTNAHKFEGQVSGGPFASPVPATTGTQGGELKAQLKGDYDLWASYAPDALACSPITGTPLSGKIAVIQRGECTFTTKINNAAAAGAVAVIIYNNVDGDPIPMSTDGALIPAVMISRDNGAALVTWDGSRSLTLDPPAEREDTPGNLANFSSWGPTPNYTLKPDVAAVGVNVYSSVVGGGFEPYSGTSMATPHVAGGAALLLAYSQKHGLGWGPAEVKAALMGTARPATDTHDPLKVGAGIIDLGRAMSPPAMALPSSLSFGLVRPVAGHTYSLTFTLVNTSGSKQKFELSAPSELSLSTSSVTLDPGVSALITATVVDTGTHQPGQGGTPDMRRGFIRAGSRAGEILVPYLYIIDYNQ